MIKFLEKGGNWKKQKNEIPSMTNYRKDVIFLGHISELVSGRKL